MAGMGGLAAAELASLAAARVPGSAGERRRGAMAEAVGGEEDEGYGPPNAGFVGPVADGERQRAFDNSLSAAGAAQDVNMPPSWLTPQVARGDVRLMAADAGEAAPPPQPQEEGNAGDPRAEPELRMRRRPSIEAQLFAQRAQGAFVPAPLHAQPRAPPPPDQQTAQQPPPRPAYDFHATSKRRSVAGLDPEAEGFVTATGTDVGPAPQPGQPNAAYRRAQQDRVSNADVTDAQVNEHFRMYGARESTVGVDINTAAHHMSAARGMHNAPMQPPRESQSFAFEDLRPRESAPDVLLEEALERRRANAFLARHRPSVAGLDVEPARQRQTASVPQLPPNVVADAQTQTQAQAQAQAQAHDMPQPRSPPSGFSPPRSADAAMHNRTSAPGMMDPRNMARKAAMQAPKKRVVSHHSEVFDSHTQDAIDIEIAGQRTSRKTYVQHREAAREISGHHDSGANHSTNRGDEKAISKWERARKLLEANKKKIHLGAVDADAWTDVNVLFYFYDQAYFENKLAGRCTWSWLDREEDDTEFRYCLCSSVPPWWQGNRTILCAGLCCKLQKANTGAIVPHAHIRIPESYRRFRLHVQVKETLLHCMIHAYLYLENKLASDEHFYEHGTAFKQLMHHINSNTITFDCYRPRGGYKVIYTDHQDDEEQEVRVKHMLDTFDDEHWKILFLISKYSNVAETWDDKEKWVRRVPLMVIIYEGIVGKVFDFDYAPSSIFVNNKRIYINESREAQDHIDDLVEAGLVRALRMMDKYDRPSTAYQCLPSSVKLLERKGFSVEDRRLVNTLVRVPADGGFVDGDDPLDELEAAAQLWEERLLTVDWDDAEQAFVLNDPDGSLVRASTVGEVEDVSYVTSPYIPNSMRTPGVEVTSNAHRAHESSFGSQNVKDEMDVNITLSDIVVFIAEWIPTGVSQITDLANRLGVVDRNKGGFFTEYVDDDPGNTQVEVPAGLTNVVINSADPSEHVMLETVITFPEEPGIVQIEHFGMRFQRSGTSFNSLRVESVGDRIFHDISLDALSRVMVDVTVDSSEVVGSLLSVRQRTWLKTVFGENVNSRQKTQLFVASRIEPKMSAKRYLDGDAIECEIKQVIGDTQHAFDVNDTDFVIFGSEGLLYVGPEWKQHEDTLLSYMSVQARTTFLDSFNTSLFATDDDIREINQRLLVCEYESSGLPTVTSKIFELTERLMVMKEVLYLLNDSIEQDRKSSFARRKQAITPEGVKLLHILQIVPKEESLARRCEDLFNKLRKWSNDIELIRRRAKQMSEVYKERLKREVVHQYRISGALTLAKIGDEGAYGLMGGIYCARFSFRFLDRIVGGHSMVLADPWYRMNVLYPLVLSEKFYWLIASVGFWCMLAAVSFKALAQFKEDRLGRVRWTANLNQPYDARKLAALLAKAQPSIEADVGRGSTLVSVVTYTVQDRKALKRWNGTPVRVELVVDAKSCIMRRVTVSYAKPLFATVALLPMDMASIFRKEMEAAGVLEKGFKHKTGREALLESPAAAAAGVLETHAPHRVYFVARTRDDVWHEVHVHTIGLEHFKERTALKFSYELKSLLDIVVVDETQYRASLPAESRDRSIAPPELVDNPRIVTTPIRNDVDLEMTPNFSRFFVTFRGSPDPMRKAFNALYANLKKDRAPGSKLTLQDLAGAKAL